MRPWSRYAELKAELRALGYHLDEQVLDASEFGVAQKRRRLFVVCDRRQKPKLVSRKSSKSPPAVKSVLDPAGTWPTTELHRAGRAEGTLERAERAFKALGKKKSFLLVYYGTDGGGGWQRLDRPLRTITTVDRFALVTPTNDGHVMRMLQVPELKRAMGFNQASAFRSAPAETAYGFSVMASALRSCALSSGRLQATKVCPQVLSSRSKPVLKPAH
jgi:DNA (cytosine-5)-methyltransferase 1